MGVGSNAMGRKPRSEPSSSSMELDTFEGRPSLYVLAGNVGPSTLESVVVRRFSRFAHVNPPLRTSSDRGETSRLKLLEDAPLREPSCLSLGDLG